MNKKELKEDKNINHIYFFYKNEIQEKVDNQSINLLYKYYNFQIQNNIFLQNFFTFLALKILLFSLNSFLL